MEKQCGSGSEQDFGSSPVTRRMQKQKAPLMIDDHNPQPAKLRKISEQTHSNEIRNQSQNLSQALDQLEIEDPLASYKSDHLTGTANQAIQIQISSTNGQQAQYVEMEGELKQDNLKIEELRKKLWTVQKNNEALSKYMEGEVKVRKELSEKQNISENRLAVMREQTTALKDIFTGFKESHEKLKEMYDNVILKQYDQMKALETQFNDRVLHKEKELERQLIMKDNELLSVKSQHQQLEHQLFQITQMTNQMNHKGVEVEKTIRENQQKVDAEVKKISDTVEDIKAKFTMEQEENSKLLAKKVENSKKFEELITKFHTLQSSSTEHKGNVEYLKSSIQELKEKRENLKKELNELKTAHLAVISDRDLEFADYREQLQHLSLKNTGTIDQLSETISSNKKLSDTIDKYARCSEELRRSLQNKDDELMKLSKDLNNASETNKELSARTQSLDEELIAQKKLILLAKEDFDIYNAKADENGKRESELKRKLALAKQELKDKIAAVAKLLQEKSDRESRTSVEMIKLKKDIEERNEQILKLRKMEENYQKEKEHMESENNKKLQQMKHSAMQCRRAKHEKEIKEQNTKIDILRQKVSAQKLEHKQENIRHMETSKRDMEKREVELEEMKSKINHLEKKIVASKKEQEDLRGTLKKMQTFNEPKSTIVQESINSSRLTGIMYRKHEILQSMPMSSTPEHSPLQGQRVKFNFDSFSDMSSINGSDIFEEAERCYADYLQNKKTDNMKISQADKIDESSVIIT